MMHKFLYFLFLGLAPYSHKIRFLTNHLIQKEEQRLNIFQKLQQFLHSTIEHIENIIVEMTNL